MSGKFTHYLITRFNVPVKNWNQDKAGRPTLDDTWMQERIELFRMYCAPTVAGQDQKDFIWIIYCDQATPHKPLQDIREEVRHVSGAQIRQVKDFDDLLRDLKQLLSQATTPYVITSRLDNDDGLGRSAMQLVQSHFIPQEQVIINLNGGVLYDIRQKLLTEIRYARLNHYGSLIEQIHPDRDCMTVLGYPHHQPPPGFRVEEVDCRYAWLKIIHDRNLKSRTSGVPVARHNIISAFGLAPDVFPVSYGGVARYMLQKSWGVLRRKLFFASS